MPGSRIVFVGHETLYVDEDPRRVASYVKPDTVAELTRDGEKVHVYGANVLYVEASPDGAAAM